MMNYAILIAAFIFLSPAVAWAQCVNPTGVEAEIVMNSTYNVPQYCDGNDWIAMKGGEPRPFNPMLSNCIDAGTLNFSVAGTYTPTPSQSYLGLWADGNFVFSTNGWMGASGGPLTVYSFNGSSFTEFASLTQMFNFGEGLWKNGDYIYVGSPGSSGQASAGLHVFSWNGTTLTHIDSNNSDVHQARQMSGDGQYIYVASGDNGVHAFTFDGTTLTKVGGSIPDTATRFSLGTYAHNGYIYIAQGAAGLEVATFDGTDFNVIDTDTSASDTYRVWHDGNYVYTANSVGIAAYTFDGSTLTHIANYPVTGGGRSLWGDGNYVYLTENGWDNGVYAFSFNGTAFSLIDSYVLPGWPRGIVGNGTYIFVGVENNDLHALNGFACANSPVETAFTHIVPKGLIGHWRLDEESGTTAYDSSGNSYDGTTMDSMNFVDDSTKSVVGLGLTFDPAQNHHIEMPVAPAIASEPEATFCAWANPIDANGPYAIVSEYRGGSATPGWSLQIDGGNNTIEFHNGIGSDVWQGSPNVVIPQQWSH